MSRRRYRWDEVTQSMVEVGAEWTDVERRAPVATEGLVYGNLGRSTDGVDISTRTRHREYMKASGTTVMSDFTESWAKAEQNRATYYAGKSPEHRRELKEAAGRALYEARRKNR